MRSTAVWREKQKCATTPGLCRGPRACARGASNRQARIPPATIGSWRRQRLLTSRTILTAPRTQRRSRSPSMGSTTRSTCRRRMLLQWRRPSSPTSMRRPRSAGEAHDRDARRLLGPLGPAETSPPFVNGRAAKASKYPIEAASPLRSSSSTTPSTEPPAFVSARPRKRDLLSPRPSADLTNAAAGAPRRCPWDWAEICRWHGPRVCPST